MSASDRGPQAREPVHVAVLWPRLAKPDRLHVIQARAQAHAATDLEAAAPQVWPRAGAWVAAESHTDSDARCGLEAGSSVTGGLWAGPWLVGTWCAALPRTMRPGHTSARRPDLSGLTAEGQHEATG